MTRRARVLGTTLLVATIASGCGSSSRNATPLVKVATAAPTGPMLLAAFADGVGAVSATRSAPVWRERDAVAALDGSAVFAIHPAGDGSGDTLVRIDPRDGSVTSTWPLRGGLSISAVAPAGKWVGLTDRARGYGSQGRASTTLVVFDGRTGREARSLTLKGDVQPEAFSTDGSRVFALDYRGDHYRVQTIQLGSGTRFDTNDRDKTVQPEDMHGRAVHGVLSADHTLLATLYRKPSDPREPAFVHVLDLEYGWSYCADLPPPFGTGAVGTDAIEVTPADTVLVAATQADRLAEIHIEAVHNRTLAPVQVTYRAGTIPPPSQEYAAIPGFDHVIAPIDA